mmetsp:Transcript_9533/g.8237  ORF Transcript_9533/g.8237 Transcript_9533/m.8237 type:complete len:95 (+) Transcript_9533:174-458(+)
MPENDYLEYFGPEYRIHMPVSNMENQNSKEYLDGINATLHEYLKYTDSSGVHITHHKESSGKDFDFDEHIKAKKDQILDEKQDEHITKNTMNMI